MLPITPQEIMPEILALFDLTKPTMPRAFNVLEGVTRGQILVDDPTQPTWAVVREASYGTLYFGGQMDSAWLATIMEYCFQFGGVGIGCWLEDPLNQVLPPNPDYDGFTLYFPRRSTQVDLEPLIQQLPPDCELIPRDGRWLAQSSDYDSTLESFGTVENILRQTLGVMVVAKQAVLCEAATGAPTHGRIEVGVTTAEAQRQRGLASAACAKLIQICETQGYATWWDCAKQNTPSARLAHKLGYLEALEYRYCWWEKR